MSIVDTYIKELEQLKAQVQSMASIKRRITLLNRLIAEYDPLAEDALPVDADPELECDHCDFVAKSKAGLGGHKRKRHGITSPTRAAA